MKLNMETWFIVVLVILLCLSSMLMKRTRSLYSIVHLPPGPLYIPIITEILYLPISFSKLTPILCNLHAKHGPIISFHFFSTPHIFITDPTLAHTALIQNGTVFADRPKFLFSNNLNQLNISSSCYGPTWRVLRRNLASVLLHPSQLKSLSNTRNRNRVLKALLNNLKSDAESNHSVIKFIDHIQHAIFSLLLFMCFGERLKSEKIEEIKIIQHHLISSSGKLDALSLFPSAISRVLFRRRWQEFMQLRKAQKDAFVELINARKNATIENKNKTEICYVDSLLNVKITKENQKQKLDENELVSLCSEFLTAGTDTTSTALEWIMANLVKYKEVQQRVVEEIEDVLVGGGRRENREVREEDLERLPFLKAVILEGLRRHPPSHFLIPHAVSRDVTLNGYLVPKNATVNFKVEEVGWDQQVWENPMEFKPERFFGDKSVVVDISGNKEIKMMPFGVGRRICPAYHLAMLHLGYFVANLVWNFEWKTSPSSNIDLSGEQKFTMVMKYPLQAHISPRI